MMKNLKLPLALFICCVLLACNSTENNETKDAYAQFFDMNWAEKSFWDDGKAEVAKYKATRIVYGKERNFDYTYILVKEVFNKEFQVKTDDYTRADLYPVMKVNKFCSFETKAYPYHYLTSVFFKQGTPSETHKLTNTSQEWCGNTAKSFIKKDDHYLFDYMSYWDGQGNGSMKVDNQPLFEDQLSYSLRALKFEKGLSFDIDLYPSQISSKAKKPISVKANISVTKAAKDALTTLGIKSGNPWKVIVKQDNGKTHSYWFDDSYPNALLKMEADDGRSLVLDSLYRDAYWSHR